MSDFSDPTPTPLPPPPPPPINQGHGSYGYQQQPTGPVKTSGLCITSLILGILSMLGLTVLTGIPAVIFGHLGLSAVGKSRGALKGGGMAIAGLVTGYLAIIIGVILILAMFPLYGKIMEEMKLKKAQKSAYQIHSALVVYAADHDQKFPDTLGDLVSENLLDRAVLEDIPKSAPANFWEYLGKGLSMEDDGETVILRSSILGKSRVIVRINGSSKIVKGNVFD